VITSEGYRSAILRFEAAATAGKTIKARAAALIVIPASGMRSQGFQP